MANAKTPQDYLIKSKLYRFVSLLFVLIGVLIFSTLYIQNVEGRLLQALKDPMTLVIFLVPFLPAAVLTFLADKNDKKYRAMIAANKEASTPKK